MNKKLVIVTIVIMSLLIGGFIGVKFFLDNSNNDEVMEKIKSSYSMVEEDIVTYNEVRDDLILVIKDYYSDNLENDYDNFLNNLKDIDEILSDINKEVVVLDELCLDRLFKDKEVNNICNNYKVYYETLVNVYMNDINKVNKFIDDYNVEYSKSLMLYSSTFVVDYIDYNNDGVYLERVGNGG